MSRNLVRTMDVWGTVFQFSLDMMGSTTINQFHIRPQHFCGSREIGRFPKLAENKYLARAAAHVCSTETLENREHQSGSAWKKWLGRSTQFRKAGDKHCFFGGKTSDMINLRAQKTHPNLESWEASDSIHLFWSDFFKDETAWRWSASILSPGGSSSCWQFVHGFLCESSALSLLPHFGSTCAWRVNEGW